MLCGSWFGIAFNNVRSRRRESSVDNEVTTESAPRCISTSQVINRSFPSVFDGSQFAPMQRVPYIEPIPNSGCVPSSGHLRTAIVGPHTVGKEYDEDLAMYSGDVVTRMSRSLYENGCDGVIPHTSTPKRRDLSNGPHRHSVQGIDGTGLYQLCNSSPSSRECSAFPDLEMYPSGSRSVRPCDLHLPSSSSGICNESGVVALKSPTTPSGRLSLNNGMNYQLASPGDKRPAISSGNSKKVIVAPQPHYRQHNGDMCEDPYRGTNDMQVVHRRRSSGAVASGYPPHYESRHNYTRDVPLAILPTADRQMNYDDRNVRMRPGTGDVRVTALEKRVRELESVISNGSGQIPTSPTSASTSFIVPVNSKSPQLIVSSVSSATTQQLMAQEIADKEVEIERLQSQLRQCYSRMELRKVQFDEEVEKFRKESHEAKSQLEKVKSRLNELENECSEYREKATLVEAARNSAIATSLEKISTQEKELSRLRGEMEHLTESSAELEKVRSDLRKAENVNSELRGMVETKDRAISELEDSIFALRMERSCKISSGSETPCDDERSLEDVETPKYFGGVKDLKELTPKLLNKRTSSSCSSSKLKKSRSSQQLSSCNEKISLSPSFSALVRKQLATIMECRLLAKCLKDTASKAVVGDLPSVNRLLGCRSESMSESEAESLPTESNPMSLLSAERHVRKGAEDLQRVEDDLNTLREKFVEYYEKKVVEDLRQNDMCKIQ